MTLSLRAAVLTLLALLITPLAATRSGVVAAPAVLSPLSCSMEGSLRALTADVPTAITFDNETAGTINIFWLDESGQRVLYNTLTPGMMATQETYVTHAWVVADASGTCLAIFKPEATPNTALITAQLSGGAGSGAAGGAVTTAALLTPVSCSTESSLRALTADVPTAVTFVNQSAATVNLFWLNEHGMRVLYYMLASGESVIEETYVTHAWVVASTTGSCLAIFQPLATPATAIIGPR